MSLFSFIQGLLPRIEKSDVQEDLRITLRELQTTVEPSYQSASEFFRTSKFGSPVNKSLNSLFFKGNFSSSLASGNAGFVGATADRMKNLVLNAQYIQEQVDKVLERDVLNAALTAKKAVLLRAAEQVSFISRFSLDALNAAYANEAIETNADLKESMQLTKADILRVERGMAAFGSMMAKYGQPPKEFEKLMGKVPEVVISGQTAEAVRGMYHDAELDPVGTAPLQGFAANPIYHVRMAVAQWQASRYKANKETAQMLQLRLLHLKLMQEKKYDPKIQKEIEYTQSRVDSIRASMRRTEEALADD